MSIFKGNYINDVWLKIYIVFVDSILKCIYMNLFKGDKFCYKNKRL